MVIITVCLGFASLHPGAAAALAFAFFTGHLAVPLAVICAGI
jgi:hypothetical protein